MVTESSAVKIRAEDGRSVCGVDISSFIGELPGAKATTAFSTDLASGSTSQAAALVEALDATDVVIVDHDLILRTDAGDEIARIEEETGDPALRQLAAEQRAKLEPATRPPAGG